MSFFDSIKSAVQTNAHGEVGFFKITGARRHRDDGIPLCLYVPNMGF
jgi:hypothetical protein